MIHNQNDNVQFNSHCWPSKRLTLVFETIWWWGCHRLDLRYYVTWNIVDHWKPGNTSHQDRGEASRSAHFWGIGISEERTIGWKPKRVRYNSCILSIFYHVLHACKYIYVCIAKQVKKWPSAWIQYNADSSSTFRGTEQALVQSASWQATVSTDYHFPDYNCLRWLNNNRNGKKIMMMRYRMHD